MPRRPIRCQRPDGSSYYETVANAKRLVGDGRAEWKAHKEIQLIGSSDGWPNHGEAVREVAQTTGRPSHHGELTEEVHGFLHTVRRLGP